MAKQRVPLETLPAGSWFQLPLSGRTGRVLAAPTPGSVSCRLYTLPKESLTRAYTDTTIARSTSVVPIPKPPLESA